VDLMKEVDQDHLIHTNTLDHLTQLPLALMMVLVTDHLMAQMRLDQIPAHQLDHPINLITLAQIADHQWDHPMNPKLQALMKDHLQAPQINLTAPAQTVDHQLVDPMSLTTLAQTADHPQVLPMNLKLQALMRDQAVDHLTNTNTLDHLTQLPQALMKVLDGVHLTNLK
jgi:hypothetical protein